MPKLLFQLYLNCDLFIVCLQMRFKVGANTQVCVCVCVC